MKLNFWQVLGAVLLVIGIVVYVYQRWPKAEKPEGPQQPPVMQSQPAGR